MASQSLPDFPYADVARLAGPEGLRIEKPQAARGAWETAPAADRPVLPDFVTDPAVPPVPPHATLDQIEAAVTAVLKGDSDRAAMVRQGSKAKVQEFLPGEGRPGAQDET